MAKRTAEFIFVGSADSVIKAAKAAGAAEAKLGTETEAAGKKVAGAHDKMGASADKAGQRAEGFHLRIRKSFHGVTEEAVKMGAGVVAAYGTIEGAKKAVEATEELGHATIQLHKNFGLTIESASKFAGIAQSRGLEAPKLTLGFKALATAVRGATTGTDAQSAAVEALNKKNQMRIDQAVADGKATADITRLKQNQAAAVDALTEKSNQQIKTFATLGISQQDLAKHGNDFQWVLEAVSDGLHKLPDGTNKAALSAKLFGRSWQDLAPLLRGGSKEMDEQLKLADKYGVTLHGKTVKSVEEMIEAQRENKLANLGLQVSLGTVLIPTITKGIGSVNHFVAGMRDGTGEGGKFADTAKQIYTDVKPVVTWLDHATESVADFTGKHDDVRKLAEAVVGVGLAVKGLKFVSAASGFTGLLKTGRSVMAKLIGVFATEGAVAGVAAGEAAAGSQGLGSGAVNAAIRRTGGSFGTKFATGASSTMAKFGWAALGVTIAAEIGRGLAGEDSINPHDSHGGGLLGGLLGALGDIGNAPINLFGKLTGVKGHGDGTGLMGATSALAPVASVGSKFGLHVSDGKRAAGTRTASGGVSYHSTGEAIDLADGKGPDANKLRFFKYMKENYGARLAELIYTPGGAGIKNGHAFTYTGTVAAEHFDHVHVAIDTGKPGVGDGLGKGALENLWTMEGGSPQKANMAAAIALAESGGNTDAVHKNNDGSIDRGPWQINSVHGSLSTLDPKGNAHAAVVISENGTNWNPWVTYKTGAYKKFLGAAAGASAGPSAASIKKQISRNEDRLDALHTQLANAPTTGTSRKTIQAQIRAITTTNRHLRSQASDLPSAADVKAEQETAGSREINDLVAKYGGGKTGFKSEVKLADISGQNLDAADTAYGQLQRKQDQSQEKLGTPEGRAQRVSEIAALRTAKLAQIHEEKKRLTALNAAIKKLDGLLKDGGKARDKATGPKRAKIVERLKTYSDKRTDLLAEAISLGGSNRDGAGGQIEDTRLDLGDLRNDKAEVENTPDDVDTVVTDKVSAALAHVDALERAGDVSPADAQQARIGILNQAIGGGFGKPTDDETLDLRGQLKDLLDAQTQATVDNTSALLENTKAMEAQMAFAARVSEVASVQALRFMADFVTSQVGARTSVRAVMPGSGQLSRL